MYAGAIESMRLQVNHIWQVYIILEALSHVIRIFMDYELGTHKLKSSGLKQRRDCFWRLSRPRLTRTFTLRAPAHHVGVWKHYEHIC